MKKSEIIMELKKQGVVAVIRGNSLEEGIGISKACIAGGLTAIEMAYTNANASEIIKQLSEMYKDHKEVCIGAGTVLDAPTARMQFLLEQNISSHHHLIMIQLFYVIVMEFLIFQDA